VKPTIILYGNCQAEAVTVILNKTPAIAARYRVVSFRNFDHPTDGPDTIRNRDLASCALLCEQHSPKKFPYRDRLPARCRTVTFPSTDFNLLWPFFAVNPFNVPDPPVFPYGRFSYGDRIIIGDIQKNMAPDDILQNYLTGWEGYKVDLDRLLQLERARIENREAQCDVRIGDYLLGNFRSMRLHWTSNHPTSTLLSELVVRLLKECFGGDNALENADIDKTLASCFTPAGPLGILSIPIHPKIAEHFELSWYDYDEPLAYFDGRRVSYEQYFTEMIAESIARKRRQEHMQPHIKATAGG
jgi:hypothetical protein